MWHSTTCAASHSDRWSTAWLSVRGNPDVRATGNGARRRSEKSRRHPLKSALSRGESGPRSSLGQTESTSRTPSRSVEPFCRADVRYRQTDGPTDHATPSVALGRIWLVLRCDFLYHDAVCGAVITTKTFRWFNQFTDEYRLSAGWPTTALRPNQPACTMSPPLMATAILIHHRQLLLLLSSKVPSLQ